MALRDEIEAMKQRLYAEAAADFAEHRDTFDASYATRGATKGAIADDLDAILERDKLQRAGEV